MNNWFNIKRFWLVVQHEFANARIELAILATVLLLGYAMPYVNEYNKWIPAVYSIGFFIYEWVLASRVFVNMRSGTQCISYLTMPASNAEKFYARLLLYWLLPILLLLLLSAPILTPDAYRHKVLYNMDLVLSIGNAILQLNAAVLFGTLFRKHGLPLLLLFETALMVAAIVVIICARDVINNIDFAPIVSIVDYVGTDLDNDAAMGRLKLVTAAFVGVSTVVNIGLARILFSRKRLRRAMLNTNVE